MASAQEAAGSDEERGAGQDGAEDERIEVPLRVPKECAGWRLDHFIKRRIPRLSRTRIQSIIAGQVSLPDGRRARPSTPVRAGEIVLLRRPVPDEAVVTWRLDALYEDEHVLVLDKPPGLAIHTTAKYFKNTVTALLRERYPGQIADVAHRLDRETSGVLLVARTAAARTALKTAFARRAMDKAYLALVHGTPPDEGVLDAPLKLLDTPTHVMMGVAPDGLPSRTRFRVLRRLAAHALVEAVPETGRQHQIRVHMAHHGWPIVGDKLYRAGEEAFMAYCDRGMDDELLAAFDGLPRHALHAHRLTFPHPATGRDVTVESPLPQDLIDYLSSIS